MEDSRIKRASDILSAFFDKDVAAKGKDYAGFSQQWRAIAGPRVGEHSKPVDIRHGILIIESEHQGWTQLLMLHQDRILGEIGKRFPSLEIRGIAYRLSTDGVEAPKRAAPPAETPGAAKAPGVPEPAESDEVSAASGLPPELKAAFTRIRKNIG